MFHLLKTSVNAHTCNQHFILILASYPAVPAFFSLPVRKSGTPGNTSHVRDVKVEPRVEPT